jgi:hypothetical protein
MIGRQQKHGLAHLPSEIQKARQRLRADIKKWRNQQQEVMPSATDLVMEVWISDPEHETLYLPSDIALDKHAEYGLSRLAVEELQLREGEAYDALDSVRHAVKYATCLRADKHKHAKGQMMNLRAGDLVRDAENKQAKCVAKYQHARLAMIGLGRSAEYLQETFPEMKPQDLWMKDVSDKHKVGDGMVTEGWIWRVGALGNMSEEERDTFSEESE